MSYGDPTGYDRFMGRWSRRLAPSFVDFARVAGCRRILDVGCGTGSLGHALAAAGGPAEICGIDPSPGFLAAARRAAAGLPVMYAAGAAERLPFADAAFDASLALLVLPVLADPARAVAGMRRVTRRGGRVAACQWDFDGGFPMLSLFWEAAADIAPDAVARRRGRPAPDPTAVRDGLAALWRRAGLDAVAVAGLEIEMRFDGFGDYWQPFLAGATPTSAFAAELDRDSGGALEAALRRRLGGTVSPFSLPARAWAVAGVA